MRNWLKHHLPKPETFKDHPRLQRFAKVLADPNLWHLNRGSTARGAAVGLFVTFLPIPFQLLLSIFGAVLFSANLPLAVILSIINNPFTFVPINYYIYRLGKLLLSQPVKNGFTEFHWQLNSLHNAWNSLLIWLPKFGKAYFLGLGITLLLAPLLGYSIVLLCWHIDLKIKLKRRKNRQV